MIRTHYFKQDWLPTAGARRWQRLHFFWPYGRKWLGVGVTIWAHEVSISLRGES